MTEVSHYFATNELPLGLPPLYLSCSQRKRELYAVDTYFRESWEDAQTVWGNTIELLSRSLTPIVFKPEAVVGRRIGRALKLLNHRGFSPVTWRTFTYTRHIIREVWRYQWNQATRERMRLVDLLEPATPSLYVILRADNLQEDDSAAEMLQRLKGHSEPARRSPQDLRALLESPCVLLNFVHTADEPADFFRELGIYFDEDERHSLLRAATSGTATVPIDEAVNTLYDKHGGHDLSLDASLLRIRDTVLSSSVSRPVQDSLLAKIDHAKAGGRVAPLLFADLERAHIAVPTWDRIVVLAHLTVSNMNGIRSLL